MKTQSQLTPERRQGLFQTYTHAMEVGRYLEDAMELGMGIRKLKPELTRHANLCLDLPSTKGIKNINFSLAKPLSDKVDRVWAESRPSISPLWDDTQHLWKLLPVMQLLSSALEQGDCSFIGGTLSQNPNEGTFGRRRKTLVGRTFFHCHSSPRLMSDA